MKSFDLQIAETIQQYLKEHHNRTLTIEDILLKPRWERVWVWWHAKKEYEGYEISMSKEDCKNIYGE